MMKVVLVLGILAILGLAQTQVKSKVAELRQLADQEPSGVISLNAKTYKYFVTDTPRPYDLVIFFTADNCKLCEQIYIEYSTVAKLYRDGGAFYSSRKDGRRHRAVFFAKLQFTEATRDIFQKFHFNSVPNILVSLPKMTSIGSEENMQAYLKQYLWIMSVSDGVITSSKLLDHVNKKTSRNVEYKEPIINIFITLGILGAVGFGGYLLLTALKSILGNPRVWLLGALITYSLCMAGIVFNILHGVPFTSVDRNGNVEWFAKGARTQLGAEGYIMSFSITLAGALLIGILKYGPSEDRSKARLLFAVFGIAFMLVLFHIESVYREKVHHYNPSFWPPAHYIRGPLMNDQGNSL
eukprot:TRINITY_DN1652_c0_g1_i2.p1 TRINITY_DN1652_c0_g1~~TRINITY_DN1652_c0_g1_i2.p1  ORF type:complete len:353 (-),score=96.74 TRINITY_DN1652_c0_g1_i2:80-1138(-)